MPEWDALSIFTGKARNVLSVFSVVVRHILAILTTNICGLITPIVAMLPAVACLIDPDAFSARAMPSVLGALLGVTATIIEIVTSRADEHCKSNGKAEINR